MTTTTALSTAKWEHWIDKAESMAFKAKIGRDRRGNLDGDQAEDGFSLDFAYDSYRRGDTPEDYIAGIDIHHVPMAKLRAALHLRYDTMEDLTLELLLATDDLPANARSVIGEIVTQREGEKAEISGELMARFDRDEPATPATYRLDTTALTVFATDRHGVESDLNAEGESCQSLEHLREFVVELATQGGLRPSGQPEDDTEDPPLAMSTMLVEIEIAEVMEREDEEAAQAEARGAETARQNDLWDAGAEARYQDELQQLARDDGARAS